MKTELNTNSPFAKREKEKKELEVSNAPYLKTIPEGYKSGGWCSTLKANERDALIKFQQSWTMIKDAKDGIVFIIDSDAPSYLTGNYQLFYSPKYIDFKTTIYDLNTQMSTFLEGFRAGLSTVVEVKRQYKQIAIDTLVALAGTL